MLYMLMAATAAILQVGSFEVGEQADPMSDRMQAVAVVRSGQSSLKIGCLGTGDQKVAVVFETRDYIAGKSFLYDPMLEYRFDSEEPILSNSWNFEPHQSYIRQRGAVGKFARRVVNSQKVAFRFDRDGGGYIDAVFGLAGAREALTRVGKSCGDQAFLTALQ